MDFRVYVIIEIPILDKKYEVFVPVDRRIHDILSILQSNIPEIAEGYYKDNKANLYNKYTGKIYDLNLIIKDSDIKNGTRLILV